MSTTDALKQITYLASALKAPRITESAARLAEHARDAGWTHEDYLAAVLEREVAARNASGARLRIRAAGMPAVKTVDDFDFVFVNVHALVVEPGWLSTATSSCSAHPEPGKPTSPPPSALPPLTKATGSCSPPPRTGSVDSPKPINADAYPLS